MPSAKFLTKQEAAEQLKLSTRTIDRMIAAGELDARKIGRSVRIPASALDNIGEPASYLVRHNVRGEVY